MKKIALLAALIISGMLTAWFVGNNLNRGNVEGSNQIQSNHIATPSGKMLHTAD